MAIVETFFRNSNFVVLLLFLLLLLLLLLLLVLLLRLHHLCPHFHVHFRLANSSPISSPLENLSDTYGDGSKPSLSHFLPKQLLREAQTIACPKDSLYTQSTQGGMPARSRWICLAGRLHACRLKWLSASSSLCWAIAT